MTLHARPWKFPLLGLEVMCRETDLFEVIDALRATGGLASCLNGRQQQSNQHADDCDYHQQLDKRKALLWASQIICT